MQLSRVEILGKRWYRGPDGILHPSAGTVLDILYPDGMNFVREEDLARGSLCHEQVAKKLVAQVRDLTRTYQPCADPEVEMRVDRVVTHLEKYMRETVAIESPTLFLGVGMTPDYVCKEVGPDGQWIRHVYDWKFVETIIERYYYQAELYGRAEKADKFTLLQCNRKGEIFPLRVRPDPERWELIKSAINVRHHLAKKELKNHV